MRPKKRMRPASSDWPYGPETRPPAPADLGLPGEVLAGEEAGPDEGKGVLAHAVLVRTDDGGDDEEEDDAFEGGDAGARLFDEELAGHIGDAGGDEGEEEIEGGVSGEAGVVVGVPGGEEEDGEPEVHEGGSASGGARGGGWRCRGGEGRIRRRRWAGRCGDLPPEVDGEEHEEGDDRC